MTILCVTNWHQYPDRLVEQLHNYNAACEGDVIHYVNVNAHFADKFFAAAAKKSIDFSAIPNLRFVEPPVPTRWASIMHAYFQAVLQAMRDGVAFDYVYFHTSADLIVKPGLNRHIRQFDIGFGRSWNIPFTMEGGRMVFEATDNPQLQAIATDPIVPVFLRDSGFSGLHKCRAEGCFFRRALFFEVLFPLLTHWSLQQMATLEHVYPQEEYLFATCVEQYCLRYKVKRCRHAIMTSKNEQQQATLEDMAEVQRQKHIFGIKRFAQNIDTPARSHALSLVGG